MHPLAIILTVALGLWDYCGVSTAPVSYFDIS